jgi:isoleucyl-tRNA synthetase
LEKPKESKEYKATLNLPSTPFSMKAQLSKREPEVLKKWDAMRLYDRVRERAANRKRFILHDGPPYANGNIHLGTALNKILKDIIVKSRFMAGLDSAYVPGWDCHGLPIEHHVDKMLGDRKKGMSLVEVRQACREYAARFIEIQKAQFKRLGVLGDWDHPYLTMNNAYVAQIVRELGNMVEKGNVYRGRKPIYWCASCKTALAEAEVEYHEHASPSIYVLFPLRSELPKALEHLPKEDTSVLIWTTTPWTLPANLAIAFHPDFVYSAVKIPDGRVLIMAEDRIPMVMEAAGIQRYEKAGNATGREWEGLVCTHPFYDRSSICILGEHVTLEQGTGCVHTAPGHGQEDFEAGLRYGLEILAPVDDEGRFTKEAAPFQGRFVFDADPEISTLLQEKGRLLKQDRLTHSYPHCWRCKKPILFRSTEQWFVSMDAAHLRRKALQSIREVEWIPNWGEERIYSMIENRPDWCISRQRSWGVPIVAFHCSACGEILLDPPLIRHVADRFEQKGPDCWFSDPPEQLLPEGTQCSACSGTSFTKDDNILDVWFDSGASFASVLEKRDDLGFPADLYLEGSDQHRGWFHSSLLLSVGTRERAPYRSVLTHGYVVDGQGKKMSKSLGNFVDPADVIEQNGAEIVRMWVSAEDYRDDIRISGETLRRLSDSYRKIRNTARFILGNLYDFDPTRHRIPYADRMELDRWAMLRLADLIDRVRDAYQRYEFHFVHHRVLDFCVVDMSSLYLDVLKDVLYVSAPDAPQRRSAQSSLHEIVDALTRLLAPVLSFTAEEIWEHIPSAGPGREESVHLTSFPERLAEWEDPELDERWRKILLFRQEVSKALETARKDKKIGHSLDAWVMAAPPPDWIDFLRGFPYPLQGLCIVSELTLEDKIPEGVPYESEEIPGLAIQVEKAPGQKCARCWVHSRTVGRNQDQPDICDRCEEELKRIPAEEEQGMS